MSKEKVVLAYSGGLDTTAIIPWLKENFGYDVICCCIDCGQGEELDGLDERAKLSGASKLYIENIVDEFADDFIMPCVKAGAVYENQYLLGTSTVSYTHLDVYKRQDRHTSDLHKLISSADHNTELEVTKDSSDDRAGNDRLVQRL